MSHFGAFCPPAAGHLDPMFALSRVLRDRGHRITFFQISDMERRIRAEGMEFRELGEQGCTHRSLAESLRRLGTLSGVEAVRFTVECACKLATLICTEAPAAVRAAGVDALLVDQNEPAAGSVAEHLDIPFISVCSGLPINRESRIPPSFTPWPYGASIWARMRNAVGYRVADSFVAPIERILNDHRRRWNLPLLHGPNDSFSRLAQLSQTTREFDFPRSAAPPCFHHLGPFRKTPQNTVPFPFDRLDGRPLIYASLGTLQNGDLAPFRAMAAACANLDAQLVLSLGGTDPAAFKDLPGSVVVVSYAPQLDLISRARLVITHAGLNTVLGALTYGVPLVAIPITNDQPGVAARVVRAGAGEVVPLRRLTPDRLRQAVERVFYSARYRSAAVRLRDSIGRAGGIERAADIIEQVTRSGSPARSVLEPFRLTG
jgi:MGT family glycosyltransferase